MFVGGYMSCLLEGTCCVCRRVHVVFALFVVVWVY